MESNSLQKTVVHSFAWKMAERIFAQGIGFLVQIVLARILLPSDFASLAIIVAITNYAALFVQSGLSTAIVQKENLDQLDISTLLISSLTIAAVFYVILFIAAPYIAEYYQLYELCPTLRVLGLILFLNAVNSIQVAKLQRSMQFKKMFIRNMIAIPVAGTIGVVMALLGFGVWALVAHSLISMLILVLVICVGAGFNFDFGFSFHRAKELYSFSGKILMASLISGMNDMVRTMIIGKKYSANDLAYYDKSYTYSSYFVGVVGYSISSVILPVLSRQQNDRLALKNTARKSIQVSTFIMFPLLFGVISVASNLVPVLLTDKWLPCVPYLILFCILRLPECMITIDKQAYYAIGRSEIALKYEIGLCITNILALIVTFKHGVLNIAIAATIVQSVAAIIIGVISSYSYGYSIRERLVDIRKPFVNSLIMMFVVIVTGKFFTNSLCALFVQVITGISVYYGLAKITKDFNLISTKALVEDLIKR